MKCACIRGNLKRVIIKDGYYYRYYKYIVHIDVYILKIFAIGLIFSSK